MIAAKIAEQSAPVAAGLTEEQRDILATAQEVEAAREGGQRVLVIGAGAGCLTGDTILHINRAGKSREMSIRHVVEQFNGQRPSMVRTIGKTTFEQRMKPWDLSIPTYVARADGDVVRLGRIENAWCSGEKEVYEICTVGSRIIRATAEHPFLTSEGVFANIRGGLGCGNSLQVNSGRAVAGRGPKVNYHYMDTKFHPHQTCKSKLRQRYGVPTSRLVVEANMNNVSFTRFIAVLRLDHVGASEYTYLRGDQFVHHIDGNTDNNHLSNLKVVDGYKAHSDEHEWVNNVLWQVGNDVVTSIVRKGTEVTYDIEVSNDPHNFIANGFVVHNTGKTFTLKQLEQVLRGNGQYTAFNSSLVAESKAKFRRASCNTTHSLAFRAVGCRFKHRLGGPRVRSYEIAARLGIEDQYVELPESIAPHEDGKPQTRRLKAAFLAGQTTEAIRKFCQSADPALTSKHIGKFPGLDADGEHANSDKLKAYLLPFAEKMWDDLTRPDGSLPFGHDVYVKLWELGRGEDRPIIAADYILLDEAQDTAPVMLSILRQQEHALLILVGDDNQQIYEWRGAVNAMGAFPGAPRRLLSQSFRFGQAVADVANAVLAGLEVPTDLVMRGLPAIPTRVCKVAAPRCYLYRTNAGAVARLMTAMDEGKRGHLIGGTDQVVAFCRAAVDLQHERGTTHPELGCFAKWSEVQEYSKEAEGADLRLMVKLIDDFTAERIIAALENMPTEGRADLVISTAHRSKGREWASVRLGPDFPTANKLDDATRRLVYVACTRAQEELDLSECPTFCGGYDRQAGGDGEGAEWVPGIEIAYTAAMPTEADLAAYRAAKSAPRTPAPAPQPAVAPAPARTGPAAARANVAPANGRPAAGEMNTWAKGRSGGWIVRGKPGQTGTVTVRKQNGTTSQVSIKRVIWQDDNVALYEV